MSHFVPGLLVKTFKTKSGKEAEIRYPQWQDLEIITDYINGLSKEDTFVTFSGEHIDIKEEAVYLSNLFVTSEFGDSVVLYCFIEGKLAGVANIDRNKRGKKRTHHVGIFGISVAKAYRADGIGHMLAKTVIEEAKKKMEGLSLVTLEVYSCNIHGSRLYEKLGFKHAGELPEGVLYKDSYTGKVEMFLKL